MAWLLSWITNGSEREILQVSVHVSPPPELCSVAWKRRFSSRYFKFVATADGASLCTLYSFAVSCSQEWYMSQPDVFIVVLVFIPRFACIPIAHHWHITTVTNVNVITKLFNHDEKNKHATNENHKSLAAYNSSLTVNLYRMEHKQPCEWYFGVWDKSSRHV